MEIPGEASASEFPSSSPATAGEVVIRPLQQRDIGQVMMIEEAAFSQPWPRATFEGFITRQDTDALVAAQGDRILGYAICWTVLDQSELGNIALAEDARGNGLARCLLAAALDLIRQRGSKECFLEVRESNNAARRLYDAAGFVVIGRRKGYYRRPVEAAEVRRKKLDSATS